MSFRKVLIAGGGSEQEQFVLTTSASTAIRGVTYDDVNKTIFVNGWHNVTNYRGYTASINLDGSLNWDKYFTYSSGAIWYNCCVDSNGDILNVGTQHDGLYALAAILDKDDGSIVADALITFPSVFNTYGGLLSCTLDNSGDFTINGVYGPGSVRCGWATLNSNLASWQVAPSTYYHSAYGAFAMNNGQLKFSDGTMLVGCQPGFRYRLARRNSQTGAISWNTDIGAGGALGPGLSWVGGCIDTDDSDDVYITGYYNPSYSGGVRYAQVMKLNSSGTIQWVRKISQGTEVWTGRTVAATDNYVVSFVQCPSGEIRLLYWNKSGTFQASKTVRIGTGFTNGFIFEAVKITKNIFALGGHGSNGQTDSKAFIIVADLEDMPTTGTYDFLTFNTENDSPTESVGTYDTTAPDIAGYTFTINAITGSVTDMAPTYTKTSL